MIRVVGDTHGKFDCLGNKHTRNHKREYPDYVIVTGDFGLIWTTEDGSERYWRKWLDDRPFETIAVLGNHENYERIYNFPIIDKYGDKVYKISEKVCALMHGHRYIIDNKKIFVYGGATSTDRLIRTPNITWWAEEVPSYYHSRNALSVLEENNWEFDYVITHTAPEYVVQELLRRLNDPLIGTTVQPCPVMDFLSHIHDKVRRERWLFGHFHVDEIISSDLGDFQCLKNKPFDII
jgi:predicted MPP superfamily phosphohydrolase